MMCRLQYRKVTQTYLIDLGRIFDIESLSMSLTTKSLLRKNSVPPETLTGISTKSAATAIGPNILKLINVKVE